MCERRVSRRSTEPQRSALKTWQCDWHGLGENVKALHIVQGGIQNGDKAWIEKAAARHWSSRSWIAPKTAQPGDDVVIYVGGYGFFATATVKSAPAPRPDWHNRYGAALIAIELIEPAISLAAIRRRVRVLTWANYPRSITTPTARVADKIRNLIRSRRSSGPDLDVAALDGANIDELRAVAVLKARRSVTAKQRNALHRARSIAVARYVLLRSGGACEGCGIAAPFQKADGTPYLEPHHTLSLADDGPDHPRHVIALCPTCHRRAHYAKEAKAFNARLIRVARMLEGRR